MQEKKDGAMLLIPSRARPHNLRRLIEACQNTGTSTPAWIRLDEDDVCVPQYRELPMPEGWCIVVGPRAPLSSVYNEAYKSLTGTTHWAFIADDVVPETPRWDKKLIEIAGADGVGLLDRERRDLPALDPGDLSLRPRTLPAAVRVVDGEFPLSRLVRTPDVCVRYPPGH